MTRLAILLSAAAGLAAIPAHSAITVIGSTSARMCYEAALSPGSPDRNAMSRCNHALSEEGLNVTDTVATHVNRGILRLRSGQIDGGIADFNAALAINPDQAEAYLNKGVALLRREDARSALPLFTVALERNTQRPALAHYGRAVAYEAMGNIPQAYRDFRRASELEPEWADPRTELQRFRVTASSAR